MDDAVSNSADLLGITSETVLALDPIIVAASRKVLPWLDFEEEVPSVEVAVCVPQ